MVSNKTGIHLGPASIWSTKDGEIAHSEATAQTFLILNVDDEEIGVVTRRHRKWMFKLTGRNGLPESLYGSKEEALTGAIAVYSERQ